MKHKTILLVAIALVALPSIAWAIPSQVDRITNHIEPLVKTDFVQGAYFVGTTTATSTLQGGIVSPCFSNDGTNCITGSGAGITSVGPAGQGQTGPTITIATSTSSFNGLTVADRVVGGSNTLTWTPSLSGTLNNTGLTNSSVSYGGVSVALGASDATPAFDLTDATSLPIGAGTTGTLAVNRGGTAITSPTANNILYVNAAGTGYVFAATSTLNIGGNAATATGLQTGRTIAITGDLAYTSPSFDGTGNVTAAGTLATVNADVGSFTCANITANGKGLITAAANGSCGGGSAYPFTPATNYATTMSATTSPIWGQAGVYASSTTAYPTFAAQQSGAGPSGTFIGGNVGIGTAAPEHLLHVYGNQTEGVALIERFNTATNAAVGTMKVKATSTGDMTDGFGSAFQFYIEDNAAVEQYLADIRGLRDGADNSGELTFNTSSAGSTAERVVIRAAGAVGIGTSSPRATLTVSTTTSSLRTIPLFDVASSTGATLFSVRGDGVTSVGTSSPAAFFSINPVAGITTNQFAVGSTSRTDFIINNFGSVGLGTTSPSARLALQGSGATAMTMCTDCVGGAGVWLDMSTDGSSGLGSGGAGVNTWIGYAQANSAYFADALAANIVYRAATTECLLSGIDNGSGTAHSTWKVCQGTGDLYGTLNVQGSTHVATTSTAVFGIGTTTSAAKVGIGIGAVGQVGIMMDAPSGQTADLFQAKVASSTKTVITAAGNIGVGTTTALKPITTGGDIMIGAPTAGGTNGDLYINKLGTAAGAFLAVDAVGKVIATTTPSAGVPTSKTGVTSRTGTTASGVQNIAHGLGTTPKVVHFDVMATCNEGGTTHNCISSGSYDGTNQSAVYTSSFSTGHSATAGNDATHCISMQDTGAQTQIATCTWDATNLIVTWVKGGTGIPPGDMQIQWTAQ